MFQTDNIHLFRRKEVVVLLHKVSCFPRPRFQGAMRRVMSTLMLLLLALGTLVVSCSAPFTRSKAIETGKMEKGEMVEENEREVQPGDVKVVDGTEFMYGRNLKFNLTPYEPEYMWIRKDEYTPTMFERLRLSMVAGKDKKENEDLRRRIERLEAELKRLDAKE